MIFPITTHFNGVTSVIVSVCQIVSLSRIVHHWNLKMADSVQQPTVNTDTLFNDIFELLTDMVHHMDIKRMDVSCERIYYQGISKVGAKGIGCLGARGVHNGGEVCQELQARAVTRTAGAGLPRAPPPCPAKRRVGRPEAQSESMVCRATPTSSS